MGVLTKPLNPCLGKRDIGRVVGDAAVDDQHEQVALGGALDGRLPLVTIAPGLGDFSPGITGKFNPAGVA
jgi:hypothetical protein